jgi:hypothetical protein
MGIPPTRCAGKTICIDATAVETEGLGLLAEPSLLRVKERAVGKLKTYKLKTPLSPASIFQRPEQRRSG